MRVKSPFSHRALFGFIVISMSLALIFQLKIPCFLSDIVQHLEHKGYKHGKTHKNGKNAMSSGYKFHFFLLFDFKAAKVWCDACREVVRFSHKHVKMFKIGPTKG